MILLLTPLLLTASAGITFASTAMPAPAVIQALGKQAGVSLRAAPVFTRQILAVRVQNVPLPELLDRMATALGGEWVEDGKVRKLERPPRLAKEIEQRERIAHAAALRSRLAELAKGVELDVPFEPAIAQATVKDALSASGSPGERAARRAPLGRLLHRLITDDVLSVAIQLRPSERAAWATSPHSSQMGFSSVQRKALDTFTSELKIWQTAVAAGSVHSGSVLGDRSEMAVQGTPSRILLVIQRHTGARGLHFKAYAADPSGRIFGRQILNLPEPPSLSPIAPRPGEKADLTLSERGARLGRLLSDPRLAWANDFARPMEKDPVADVSDLLVEAASRRQRNVLAVLPDSLFRVYPELYKAPVTASQALIAADRYGASYREADGWATLAPRHPWTAERLSIDRKALERMLSNLEKGASALDAAGDYLASGEREWAWGAIDYTLAEACLGSRTDKSIPSDGWALACFGSLSPAQREALARSGPTPVSRLSQPMRANLTRMAYETMGVRLRRRPPESDGAALRDLELSLATENTEVLPHGLPPEATLTRNEASWKFSLHLGPGAELTFELAE